MRTSRGVVLRAALLSRVLVLIVSAAASNYAEPYDCSSTVSVSSPAMPRGAAQETRGQADRAVHFLLSGLARWDAVYFLRLAHTSTYEFEQFHAFFPFFPACIRGAATCLRFTLAAFGAGSALSSESLILIAGAAITHLAFVAAAVVLYELSAKVLNDERLSLHASVLFCFSPASIFFSAIYTESPFALASFVSMLCFLRADGTGAPSTSSSYLSALQSGAWFLAGIVGATVATAIRSNGIVLAAFGLHVVIRHAWIECRCRSACSVPASSRAPYSRALTCVRVTVLMRAVTAALLCLIVALPFIRFQLYAHDLYCIAKNSGQTMSRERRPWCVEDGMSNLYAFVQREYWNQGPFRYWTLKQIPNFLLAAPVLLLSAAMAFHYKSARTGDMNIEPLEHITMLERLVGFDADTKMVATSEPAQCDGDDDDDDANQKTRRFPALTKSSVFESRKTAAFVWHCAALSVLMLICFHVQVATRFLFAASPALYWYVADLVERHGENSWAAHIVLGYFCVYFILGATLFSTFYPWT